MSSLFGGGSGSVNNPQPPDTYLRVQSAVSGTTISVVYGTTRLAGNLIDYTDFTAIQQSSGGGGGGKGGITGGGGGKGQQSSGQYDYQVAVAIAICEGPINAVFAVYNGSVREALSALNLVAFLGGIAQAPWGYMSTNHPERALTYSNLAYAAAGLMDLGNSSSMPNLTFEVQGALTGFGPLGYDADPSAVIRDYLVNTQYGVGFPVAFIGNWNNFQTYCAATGMFISPAISSQTAANSFLKDLMTALVCEFVFSGASLTIVPYYDQAITGNGTTYTPPSSPIYALGDDDFLPNEGTASIGVSVFTSDDPVVCVRKRPSDVANWVQVEYLSRGNNYNPTVVDAKDSAAIDVYGIKTLPKSTAHFFCLDQPAYLSAQLQLGRQAVMNQYSFTVPWYYILLDPMDIISITDTALGLNNQWVRIIEMIENQEDWSITIVAEEYMSGTGSSPIYGSQINVGEKINYNAPPGAVNAPILFGMPIDIASIQGLMIGAALSGSNPVWGGCNVHISSDGVTYRLAGQPQRGASRMGVTTSNLPISTDPDITDTLGVNLTESFGVLLPGTQADADNQNTLCIIGDQVNGYEFITYESADLTSQYNYNLGTYLRRGQQSSAIANHPTGSQFARVDVAANGASSIYQIPYTADQIGDTLFVKFTSFNIWGGAEEDISDVAEYSIILPEPPPPPDVENFKVQQNGDTIMFSWLPVEYATLALAGYDLGYAPEGTTDWNKYSMFLEASNMTTHANAGIPPGAHRFGIRAANIAHTTGEVEGLNPTIGLSPDITFVDFTVANVNTILYSKDEAPDWLGIKSGFILHYTGVLIPDSNMRASAMSNAALFEQFVPSPVNNPTYTTNVVDTIITTNDRVWFTTAFVNGFNLAPASILTLLDSWPGGGSDSGIFTPWTMSYIVAEFFRGRLTEITNGTLPANIVKSMQEPDWLGTKTGFLLHYTGVLIPDSTVLANTLTNTQLFTQFVHLPVTTRIYTSPTVDLGAIEAVSTSSNIITNGSLTTSIDYWSSGSDPNAYVPWTSANITARYFNTRITQTGTPLVLSSFDIEYDELQITPPATVTAAPIAHFQMTIDATEITESIGPVAIGSSGTTVIFNSIGAGPFHEPPQVLITVDPSSGGNPTSGGASSITTTQAFIQLFAGDVEVAGNATLTFNGV